MRAARHTPATTAKTTDSFKLMTRQSDYIIDVFRRHVFALRRGCDDAVRQTASGREAIEHSHEYIRLVEQIKTEQRR